MDILSPERQQAVVWSVLNLNKLNIKSVTEKRIQQELHSIKRRENIHDYRL